VKRRRSQYGEEEVEPRRPLWRRGEESRGLALDQLHLN